MARKQGQAARSKKTSKQMRAVSTRVAPPADVTNPEPSDDGLAPQPVEADAPVARRSGSAKGRPYQHRKATATATARLAPAATVSMSKDQEYAFIREDLRRLLLTAGVLVVVMIVLLVAIGQ